jgi:manganese/zinc/iron transport system permease protein
MEIISQLTSPNAVTVILGLSLLGFACGTIGTFAVLRRQALLSDAIAHAALPGVCLAYLLSGGSRNFTTLLAGAVIAGLTSIWLLSFIRHHSRVKDDASIAIVLSTLFGAGITLSRLIQNNPAAAQAGLDDFIFGKAAHMLWVDVVMIGLAATVVLMVTTTLFRELTLICFDREYALLQQVPVRTFEFLLMVVICMCTAAGLPAVGAVLVSALIIFPASTARLWTDQIATTTVLAAAFGLCAAFGGAVISVAVPISTIETTTGLPTGPVVVLCCAALFITSALIAPLIRHRRARP